MTIRYDGALIRYRPDELQPLNTHLAEQTLHALLAMKAQGQPWGYGRVILLDGTPLIDDGTHRAFLTLKQRQPEILMSTYDASNAQDLYALALMEHANAEAHNREQRFLSDEEFARIAPRPAVGDGRPLARLRQTLRFVREHGIYRLSDLEHRVISPGTQFPKGN